MLMLDVSSNSNSFNKIGFLLIRGGNASLLTKANSLCTNDANCAGQTNANCTNSGTCDQTTNMAGTSCSNLNICFY